VRLRYAYNTNGLQNHRLEHAIALLADTGYDGVALTLDIHHLDPYAPDLRRRAEQLRRDLDARGLSCVIETGARFLLDPRRKHEPTLISPQPEGRMRRLHFLCIAVEVGAWLGAEAVSFWAGVPRPEVDPAAAWGWLTDGIAALAAFAADRSVPIALEPEPGMLIETVDDWSRLRAALPSLRLALDVGHCLVTRERDPAEAVRAYHAALGTVALDDMRIGVHEHLPFGDGDLDLPAVLCALREVGWRGLCCVELSRDSHRAHTLVGETLAALRKAEA
jgi:sugar phosphate isomerase/epimerase